MAREELPRIGDGRRQPLVVRGEGLGDVARDAIDHATVLVRDTVAVAKLEARQTVEQALASARRALPVAALGVMAAALGLAGVVLGLIAIFIALGDVVPSVAWRLAIFAIVFLAVAGFCAAIAASMQPARQKSR